MEQFERKKRERLLLWLILVAAALLRFYRLGAQSFWTDELLSIEACTPPPGYTFFEKMLWDVHGPLYSLILHLWSKVSLSEWWLRIPSATFGLLSVYLAYRWFVAIRKRNLALIAAMLMALSPFNIYYSQELRFYSMLTCAVFISLIVFQRFIEEPDARTGSKLGVVLVLSCLSHFSAMFICAAFLVYLLLTKRFRGAHLKFGLLAALIVIVVVSPWIYREIYFLRRISVVKVSSIPVEERFRGEQTLNAWAYPYTLYAFSVGYSFGPDLRTLHFIGSARDLLAMHGAELLLAMVLFGGLFVSGLIRAVRDGPIVLLLSIAVVSLLFIVFITFMNIKVFNVRYLTSTFPVFMALLAFGFPVRAVPRAFLITAVCAVMLVSDWNYHMVPRFARDDVRGAARIVEREEIRGDLIIVPVVKKSFEFYYGGANEVVSLGPGNAGDENAERMVREIRAGYSRIWYVRCRQWDADSHDVIYRELSAGNDMYTEWEMPGIRLVLFTGSP